MVRENTNHPDLEEDLSEKELKEAIQSWILNHADKLSMSEAIAPMTGELFVPFKYSYPDILRVWLETFSRANDENCDSGKQLCEKIIEETVIQEYQTGELIKNRG